MIRGVSLLADNQEIRTTLPINIHEKSEKALLKSPKHCRRTHTAYIQSSEKKPEK